MFPIILKALDVHCKLTIKKCHQVSVLFGSTFRLAILHIYQVAQFEFQIYGPLCGHVNKL